MAKKMTKKKNKLLSKINGKADTYLKRRPHRTFRLTRRRDYVRKLELPGYIAFTKYVYKTIWKYKKYLGLLALLYGILTILMVGLASEEAYSTLRETLNSGGSTILSGAFWEFGKAGLLFVSSAAGGISQNLTEAQQIYAGIIVLLTWLSCVWLLRNLLAGHKVKLRDGVYSSGSPIVPTFIICCVLILQLLPLTLGIIGINAASGAGLLGSGVQSMMFWIAAIMLGVLSFYWATSTLFALIIVTIPGMYPYAALKAAGDIVVGRRLRILYRFIWMALLIVLTWAVIMIPVILLDGLVKSKWAAINWMPTVPFVLLLLSSVTVVFVSSYIYLLYRKVVDDGAEPA